MIVTRWVADDVATPTMSRADRLLSLDAFRGATVAAMVLVNNPGTWRAVDPPRRMARLDPHRPDLPVLPVHRRSGDPARPGPTARRRPAPRRRGDQDPAAERDHLRAGTLAARDPR